MYKDGPCNPTAGSELLFIAVIDVVMEECDKHPIVTTIYAKGISVTPFEVSYGVGLALFFLRVGVGVGLLCQRVP